MSEFIIKSVDHFHLFKFRYSIFYGLFKFSQILALGLDTLYNAESIYENYSFNAFFREKNSVTV